ncbi:unnamed protein product [Gongylonema pulchrum]|uniref:UDENN FLCN/SMCR8-type domain-containing protein n=1 Tax=Gongylonema pulchrum TaxID=637853 RepID=A0A183EDH2_9BILA|nr:unnamed protein product [Gongylonema pulchrum]
MMSGGSSSKASPSRSASASSSMEDAVKWEEPWVEADDGVILFGDDEHGYTLSSTFRLRDRKARGFLRLFSLVLICMDKLLITNNYDFFVSSMSSIIRYLQVPEINIFV